MSEQRNINPREDVGELVKLLSEGCDCVDGAEQQHDGSLVRPPGVRECFSCRTARAIRSMHGALRYLRTQARNGTLHPQVVIQNVDNVLGSDAS